MVVKGGSQGKNSFRGPTRGRSGRALIGTSLPRYFVRARKYHFVLLLGCAETTEFLFCSLKFEVLLCCVIVVIIFPSYILGQNCRDPADSTLLDHLGSAYLQMHYF